MLVHPKMTRDFRREVSVACALLQHLSCFLFGSTWKHVNEVEYYVLYWESAEEVEFEFDAITISVWLRLLLLLRRQLPTGPRRGRPGWHGHCHCGSVGGDYLSHCTDSVWNRGMTWLDERKEKENKRSSSTRFELRAKFHVWELRRIQGES